MRKDIVFFRTSRRAGTDLLFIFGFIGLIFGLAAPAAEAFRACDLSVAVTAKSVMQQRYRGKNLTLVDVRAAGDFQRLRIPGSINLPLHAVKAKTYLQQTPLVLVDGGFGYNRLAGVCEQLNRNGFTASVLYGGLPAWYRFGGRLEGDRLALREHHRISFEEFYAEKDYGNQFVVYVGRNPSADSDLPSGVHLSLDSDPRNWAGQLKPYLKKSPTYPYVNVVLLSEDNQDSDRVLSLAALADLQHWYFLEGGITGYLDGLRNIALAARPKDQRIKIIGSCLQCAGVEDFGHKRNISAEPTSSKGP